MTHEEILRSNKAKNVAMLNSHLARLGVNRQLARSVDELIAIEGKNPLIGVTQPGATEQGETVEVTDKIDAGASIIDEPYQSGIETQQFNIPENNMEQKLHAHFDLGGSSSSLGDHLSCSEIAVQCLFAANKINTNAISATLKKLGFVSSKIHGKNGFRMVSHS